MGGRSKVSLNKAGYKTLMWGLKLPLDSLKTEVANEVAAGEFCEATLGIQDFVGEKNGLDACRNSMIWRKD